MSGVLVVLFAMAIAVSSEKLSAMTMARKYLRIIFFLLKVEQTLRYPHQVV